MNQWWVDDLPLPLPHTTYKWARDHDMLVSFHTTMFWKRLKTNPPRTSWACQQPWPSTIAAQPPASETTSSRVSTSPASTTSMFLDVKISFLQLAETISARDLVARPEEAWASLASFCRLDPTNAKPLEAHKKLALASKHSFKTKSWLLHQIKQFF